MYLNNRKSLYYHKLDKFVSYGEVPNSSAITDNQNNNLINSEDDTIVLDN